MFCFFFFSSRRRHTRYWRDWSSDVCSSDLEFVQADPDPAAMLADADAALVIGDVALRIAIAAEAHVTPGPDGEWLTPAAALADSLVATQYIAPAERLHEESSAILAVAFRAV